MAASASRLVLDDKERFGDWAITKIPYVETWGSWYEAIGLERDGSPIAAVIYNRYTGTDISMSYAGTPGTQWLTKGFLRAMWAYPFLQLKVQRVTGLIASRNEASLQFAQRMGAKVEGRLRNALPDDDQVLVGMIRSECRWV